MYGYQQYSGYYPQSNQLVQPNQLIQPQFSTIYGKIVDSEDVARNADVPVGQYAVFPKGNLAEVYIKSWNDDGTTKTITYTPKQDMPATEQISYMGILENIEKSLVELSKKFDANRTPAKPMKKVGGSDAE